MEVCMSEFGTCKVGRQPDEAVRPSQAKTIVETGGDAFRNGGDRQTHSPYGTFACAKAGKDANRPGIVSRSSQKLVFDTIAVMARLSTPAQIAGVLVKAADKFGFNSLGINGLPPLAPDADPFVLAEQVPTGFREFYVHERLYAVDHLAAYGRTAVEPFRYSEAPYDRKASRQHERFMQALQHYGVGQGIVVPVGRQASHPACVWLAGPSPELDDDAIQALQLIALFAAARAFTFLFLDDGRPALSPREREVLMWTARGKSAWEIGEILNISKRTADAHVQAATAKLRAVNKTQAVATAILRRVIEI
jgi:LuxR family transcriptional regulator, quorum-sensing system regulator BjaR1